MTLPSARGWLGVLAFMMLAASGCDGARQLGPAGSGDARFRFEFDDLGDLVASRDGVELVRVPRDGLALGVVDDDAGYNYDPWWLEDESVLTELAPPPRGLRWLVPTSVAVGVDGAASIRASFAEGRSALVSLTADAEGRFGVTIVPEAGADAVAYLRVAFAVTPDERFYGLGNHHDRPEIRGKRVALQLEPDPSLDHFYNERHVTTPLLVATSGWAALFESDHPGVVDVAHTDPDRVVATFGIGLEGAGRVLPFRLFLADHPLDVYRHYYAVTGPPRVPADWGFGPWFWRDETPGQGASEPASDAINPGVLHDLATIRALDLPTSGYWIDRPYASALQTFDFDPARYDDPAAMVATAHRLGFRVALWHAPYMTEAAGEGHAAALAANAFPPQSGIALNTFGGQPIDFTNPDAVQLWADGIAAYTSLGIEGFKLDFGEDVVPGLPGARANVWRFASGEDERTMHARYAALYHAPYVAAMPAGQDGSGGGFILARAAGRGGHTHVDVLWPGDLDADFARHGDRPDGATTGRVGGIPAALAYHLSVTASGLPFFAADTGGYQNGPPTAEAFSRWFEMTALAPVMQVGGDDNHAPWELDAFGYDQGLLDRYRELARLHIRLFPFFRSEAARLAVDGRPVVRALGLARPELGVHPDDQYLLGDALLVAPVVEDGAREREVVLPPGRWVSWWDAAETVVDEARGARRVVAAPLGRPPLWLAEGAIVPMLRPTVDTLAATTEPGIDSAADVPGRLWVRIVRGKDGDYTLHDGGRVTVEGESISWSPGTRYGPGIVLELVADAASGLEVEGRGLEPVDADGIASGEGWRQDGPIVWVGLAGPATVHMR